MKWDEVQYEVLPTTDPALLPVLQELQATRVNGGVILKIFRPVDPSAFDRATREDLRGFPNMLRCFLEAPSVRSTVPELQLPCPLSHMPQFAQYSGFEFEGAVTRHLLFGGAYVASSLDEETARQYSRDFVDGLLGQGRLHSTAWGTEEPWTPWFHDVAWDVTFVILQRQTRQWALFCITDTD